MPGTLVAVLGAAQPAAAAAPAAAPAVACDPIVEVIRAMAWPVIALVLALVLRRPLSTFVAGLGTRVSKVSVFNVALELVPAAPSPVSTPLLDDIRTATTSAKISDSTRMMLDQVQSGAQADFAVIGLGSGQEWLTSRLYIAATLLERMRGVQVLVFVERSPATERRLLAVAPAGLVRWALAQRYAWLEAAWARAYLTLFPGVALGPAPPLPPNAAYLPDPRTLAGPSLIKSSNGAVDPSLARQVASRFIDSLQQPAPPVAGPVGPAPMPMTPGAMPMAPGPPAGPFAPPVAPAQASPPDWVALGQSVRERASWVTRELLSELLPADAFLAWTDAYRDAPPGRRTRAVLRRAAPFVALVEGDREFVRLVNRRALLEEIAASLGEEPESAAAP